MPAINRHFRQGRKALLLLLTALAALLFVFPIYIAVITSFKTPLEIAESILALPQRLRWMRQWPIPSMPVPAQISKLFSFSWYVALLFYCLVVYQPCL